MSSQPGIIAAVVTGFKSAFANPRFSLLFGKEK
jgi:hypothetical protein